MIANKVLEQGGIVYGCALQHDYYAKQIRIDAVDKLKLLVILEALSCGVPCIVSNLAGGDDAIVNGENGFVFNAGDDNDLKKKIEWFIEHPGKIERMSYASRKSVENLTWDAYHKAVSNTLSKIINKEVHCE